MSMNEELQSANGELEATVEELRRKMRRLELAWEAARGGIYEHRVPLDETTYHSEHWAQLLGYRREELPPHEQMLPWVFEQTHPEDRARLEQEYTDFIEGRREHYEVEVRLRHRAGHWLWLRGMSKALERDAEGRVRHLVGTMIDITDQKKAEEAMRESESRFREMTNGLPLIVWVHDESGRQEHVNRTFCEFFGVTEEEMKGGSWEMLMHPDDAERYKTEFYRAVEEQRPFHAETRVKGADGSWRWLESWGKPRRTRNGVFRGFVGTSADVTERKRIEADLRESEERFRLMADNIAQLAWMANGDGWIFWYNKRWHDYTGTTLSEMEGWGWQKVHHPQHVERVVEKIRHCFERGEVWEDTFPLRGTDGKYRWFLSRAIPIRDASGRVVRWFGTNTDVTEQRVMEQRLLEADRQKDAFIAMLGHELRNPLGAIRTAVEVIKLGGADEQRRQRILDVLVRQTGHMATLLDGLLDISRIVGGKIKLDCHVVDFGAVCQEVVSDLAERATSQGVQLRAEMDLEPVPLDADRVRLTQIVDNLLSNSIKYTPAGGCITLSLSREHDTAVLKVRDTGVGIEPSLLPHVFEAFRQSEQNLARSHGGLGLGLALVRSLVEMHGGSVEAASEGENRGSEFVVRLPVTAKQPPDCRVSSTDRQSPLRVLVIEDNEDAAEMLQQVLEFAGHEAFLAYRGRQGVTMARELRPDVVLCDLGLPEGMNGFDVARELRSDPCTARTCLVALSGYGRPEDKIEGERAGFQAHLTKPVDVKALQQLLEGIAG